MENQSACKPFGWRSAQLKCPTLTSGISSFGEGVPILLAMPKRPSKIYQFGDEGFTSKKAAAEFFAKIRMRVGQNGTVTDLADVRAVADLLRGHVEHEDKVKCGVKRFFVAIAPDHPNTTCSGISQMVCCSWVPRVRWTDFPALG